MGRAIVWLLNRAFKKRGAAAEIINIKMRVVKILAHWNSMSTLQSRIKARDGINAQGGRSPNFNKRTVQFLPVYPKLTNGTKRGKWIELT